jgi:hypothetical protein
MNDKSLKSNDKIADADGGRDIFPADGIDLGKTPKPLPPMVVADVVIERAMAMMQSRGVPWTVAFERLVAAAIGQAVVHAGREDAATLLLIAAADVKKGSDISPRDREDRH